MKKIIAFVFIVITTSAMAGGQPDHSIFDRLLNSFVTSAGKVDYEGMRLKEDTLDAYLIELKAHAPSSDWSSSARKAYYINAYNAYTLKFVLLKYPIASVKDVSFSGRDIWELRLVKLGDKTYNLEFLENQILRKMKDPRIHFAINCASYSCPKLWNHAFTEDNVNNQLTKLTKEYINNPKHNEITEKKIKISKIFEWYAEDFISENQTLIQFLNKYSTQQINLDAKVEYLPYNWSLNE